MNNATTADSSCQIEADVIRSIAMEAAALTIFARQSRIVAIAAAVANHVSDTVAARECRGTMASIESSWIPAGEESLVREVSESFMDEVALYLRHVRENS